MSKATLRSWHAQGRWWFVARFAAIGALSGFAAWALIFGAHLLFGIPRPTGMALILAVPRGALFGAILALLVDWRLSRRARTPSP
jgi:hypothetical protein